MCCFLAKAALLCLLQALFTCNADRLPEGPPGSEPPHAGTAVCRRVHVCVCVIKNVYASLHPVRRCHHLGWDATAAC